MVVDKETAGGRKIPYPKSVIFIILTELCERFSYYGMKAILVLYFRFILHYTDNSATQAYHIFAMACYFTPIIGAFIADSLLGKFWTILSISILYAAGNILIAIASINGTVVLTFLGLGFIAFGTGGIKPCVAAFGGDQFRPEQGSQLKSFFSLFYISINAGSLISTFITPILRQDVACMGRNDCYPLAFGVPAILMVTALSLFILGRFLTNYVMVPPQADNVVVMVVKCVFHALGKKMFGKGPKKGHWLEYADDQYDSKTIAEVKVVMAVLFLYLPLPIFWSLFDQTGSRWTLQALRMNGKLGGFTIKPDQIQVINPVLIILMIPVYQYVIYPLLEKLRITRPLQKMTIGGLLAGVSFLIVGLIQFSIETEIPIEQAPGHNHAVFVNGLSCPVFYGSQQIDAHGAWVRANLERDYFTEPNDWIFKVTSGANCASEASITVTTGGSSFPNMSDTQNALLFLSDKLIASKTLDTAVFNNTLVKPDNGGALLFTLYSLANYKGETFKIDGNILENREITETFGILVQTEVEVTGKDTQIEVGSSGKAGYSLDQGAAYIQLISGDMNGKIVFKNTNVVEKNKLSVFMQIIPYFVITCAEVMFSVTGLEFSYSQAPKSMKAVLQAAWLLTVAFGNLIIALIADAKIFPFQSYEFLFFAALMVVDIAIFAVMAYFYVPSTINEEEETSSEGNAGNFPQNGKKAVDWDD